MVEAAAGLVEAAAVAVVVPGAGGGQRPRELPPYRNDLFGHDEHGCEPGARRIATGADAHRHHRQYEHEILEGSEGRRRRGDRVDGRGDRDHAAGE